MTQHYYIRSLFAQNGLIPNEHFMNGLMTVCSITGCSAEAVIYPGRKSLVVYTRHMWFWLMKGMGFSAADIGEITGIERSAVAKALERLDDRAAPPYMLADMTELSRHLADMTKSKQ